MIRRLAFGSLCALLLAVRLGAAEQSGIVTFNGVPVPGATITASQGEKTAATVTDHEGKYTLPGLADGSWTIHVSMRGFADVDRDVTVGVDATPAAIALALRSFEEMARALPPPAAAAPPQSAAPQAAAPGRTPAPNGDRARPPAAGNTAARPAGATAPPAAPGEEAANPGNAAAADGLLINGSVNNAAASPFAQLAAFGNNRRNGRSLYNGGMGVVFGNSALDARPFSFTGRDSAKPSYSDIQILGTFGGPLKVPGVRNGPQIYVGYQWLDDNNASAQSALMPTDLERIGDFSQSRDALGRPIQVRDPRTGVPFTDNRIPRERITTQASALLNLYPHTNSDGSGYNYETTTLSGTHTHNVQFRATQTLRNRDVLAGNLLYTHSSTEFTGLFGFEDEIGNSGTDAAINWTHRFSPFFSTRTRYQFLRQGSASTPFFAFGSNVSGDAGISGNNQDPENWGPPGLTFANGLAGLGSPQFSRSTTDAHLVSEEIYRSVGRHSLTFGGGVTRNKANVFGQQDARGGFAFTGLASGSDFADFLLGTVSSSSIAFGNSDKRLRGISANAYLSDDWRASPSLTITAGVRWEYEGPLHELENRLGNLDVAPNFSAIDPVDPAANTGAITGASYPKALLHADWRGIQPRLGVAWRPVAGSSLLVRGGYGVYRNTAVYQGLALLLAQQAPSSTVLSVSASEASPLTLANGFIAPVGVPTNTLAIDPDFRVGFAENWQMSAQRDLPASMTILGTYFGTRGHHLPQQFLPNTYPAGAATPCAGCPVGFVYVTSNGDSHRHAGQVQLRRRLRNGLQASIQYTLATATDNASSFVPTVGAQGAAGSSGLAGATTAQDWLDLDAEESRSSFDQRHLVTTNVQYTTGQGITGGALLSGWRGRVFKGWTFNGTMSSGSGLPVTPIVLVPVKGTGVTGTTRATLTGAPVEGQADGSYANPAAFVVPAAGTWGNAERFSITGPGTFAFDGGLARSFIMKDRYTFDWRLDIRNMLNVVTYSGINSVVGSPQFGLPNRANTMRKIQTSLRMRF